MNREAADRWCGRAILGLLLAILVFGPLALGAVGALPFLVIQTLTICVLALWGVRLWLGPKPKLLWPPICWAVLAFVAYAVVRYFNADIEYVARQELLHILVYAFLFFAILNHAHEQQSAQIVSLTVIILAMGISFYALYQYMTGSDRVWQFITPYKHRATGTYFCPNHLAGFLELVLPLGLGLTLVSRLKPLAKIFLGYASLVIMAGIAVTVSRGGWISTALALLFFFGVLSFHRVHRLPAVVLLAVIIGGCIFLVPRTPFFRARGERTYANGQWDDGKRFLLWAPAIRIWRENVWWGAGPGHFDYRFREFRPETVQRQADHVHNDYLNALADWGVAGTALVAAAWVLLAAGAIKTWRVVRGSPRELGERRGSNKYAFVVGAAAGLVAILLHSVVDFNMYIPANAILAVALMALLSSHLRFATERYWVTLRPGMKLAASAAQAAGMVFIGQQTARLGAEYVWLDRAAKASTFSTEQVQCLSRAFAAEPRNASTAYQIGEALRRQSQEGGESYGGVRGLSYRQIAELAMQWFERSMKLDRWNGYGFLGYGWCLDWLGRTAQAEPYFAQAERLDPNGYFTIANIGLHYIELQDYAAARPWFERSLRLQLEDNLIAANYLAIANRRLAEAATNDVVPRPRVPEPGN